MNERTTHESGQAGESLAEQLLASVTALHRQLRALGAAHRATPTEMSMLACLDRRGPARAGALAKSLTLNPTLVSRLLHGLAGSGHITRERDAADARACTVSLTAGGRELLDRGRALRAQWMSSHLGQLTAEQAETLLAALPALHALGSPLTGTGDTQS